MHIFRVKSVVPDREEEDAGGDADLIVGDDVGVLPTDVPDMLEDGVAALAVVDEDRVAGAGGSADERSRTGLDDGTPTGIGSGGGAVGGVHVAWERGGRLEGSHGSMGAVAAARCVGDGGLGTKHVR